MHMFIKIGNLQIPGYGLMIVLGVLLANIIAFLLITKRKLNGYDFIILEGYGFLGAMAGAKLLYLFVVRHQIDWIRMFELDYFSEQMRGGFVFYGGLIGGILFLFLASKLHRIRLETYLKNFMFLIPLMHAFGRVGCHNAGCCYGRPYSGSLAVVFPADSLAPAGVPLFPVQIIEAVLLFLLSMFVYKISKRVQDVTGVVISYMIGYSIIRFGLEFFRNDENRGFLFGMSTSQWISIILFMLAIGILFKKIVKNK